MFTRRKIDTGMIDTTSKISLKLSCLRACDNDVRRAGELYAFLAADLADLPDMDPVKPSALTQLKDTATGILDWVNGHRDEVSQGLAIVKAASSRIVDVPPIPKI